MAVPPIQNPAVPGLGDKPPEVAFGTMIAGIVGVLLTVASIWAFFQLILGGINWISSGGDKGKVEAAQQRLTQAIIGLMIVFASWAIFILILQFFGIISLGTTGEIKLKLPTIF